MESSTKILRRLLDERGADYRVSATGYSIDIGPYTTAYANRSDTTLDVSLRQVTPEQAIAATLGNDGVGRTNDGLADLQAENAKLREDLEFERSENGWVREFLNRMGQKCGTRDCPSLVAYVTKLEAENVKLLEIIADLNEMLPKSKRLCIYETAIAFADDNAKLRELVRDMYEMAYPEYPSAFEAAFADRMRELGAEVDK